MSDLLTFSFKMCWCEAHVRQAMLWLQVSSEKLVHEKYTPLNPYFIYKIVGFAGVYLFLLQNIDCGYS